MYNYSSAHVNFKQNSDSELFFLKDVKIIESQNTTQPLTLAEPNAGYILFVMRGNCELVTPGARFLNTSESLLFFTGASEVATLRSLPHSRICVIRFNPDASVKSDALIYADACTEQIGSSIVDFLLILLEEYNQQEENWQQICNYLLQILYTLYHRFASQKAQSFSPNENMSPADAVKQYIDRHYMEKINIASIAKSLFISESTVSHCFVSAYKITVAKYIIQVRINESKRCLEETYLSIEEIAEKVGFSSLTTFYRNFSNYTGLSPGEYREKHLKKGRKFSGSIVRP